MAQEALGGGAGFALRVEKHNGGKVGARKKNVQDKKK